MKTKKNKQIAIVTGATGGIGMAIIQKLLQNDYFIVALSKSEVNTSKVKELLKVDKNIKYFNVDLSKSSSIKKAFLKINNQYKYTNVLINNAGISSGKKLEKMKLSDLRNEIEVNFVGLHLCLKYSLPLLKRSKEKKVVVNIASERGQFGSPNSSVGYAATKAAVINLSKSYAMQLAKYGIRVNCVSPAAIYPTGMSEHWSDELKKVIIDSIPLRKLGSPEDVANVIGFLTSNKSKFITGETINVNGGFKMI